MKILFALFCCLTFSGCMIADFGRAMSDDPNPEPYSFKNDMEGTAEDISDKWNKSQDEMSSDSYEKSQIERQNKVQSSATKK